MLGIGGWRLLEMLGIEIQVCHLNEGHAAFAVLARAASFAEEHQVPFTVALQVTRAGNVFTTHTPVEVAFDQFDPALVARYALPFLEGTGTSIQELLALGRKDPADSAEPFKLAYVAVRGCGLVNGVARLHGRVSRRLFRGLFRGWPEHEVPIGHITNGVHIPTWNSVPAQKLWSELYHGTGVWLDHLDEAARALAGASDEQIWEFRCAARQMLVEYVRRRWAHQLRQRGAPRQWVEQAQNVLDPNPRRPNEACGTSGMKTLLNGGLHLSTLDGWWDEAFVPEAGWAIGDGSEHNGDGDAADARRLYEILEQHVIPEFYERNHTAVPRTWVQRIRCSMSRLVPQFSSDRMVREYVAKAYLPAAESYRRRAAHAARLGRELEAWQRKTAASWHSVRFGGMQVSSAEGHWLFVVQAYLGELRPADVEVQLYAVPFEELPAVCQEMERVAPIVGAVGGYHFRAQVPGQRPARHFTPRIIPFHPDANVPLENSLVCWYR